MHLIYQSQLALIPYAKNYTVHGGLSLLYSCKWPIHPWLKRPGGSRPLSLNNKTEAIQLVINEYEKELLERELRPEYIEKMKEREKEPPIKVKE